MLKLKKRSQFQKVYKKGKLFKREHIWLSLLLNNGDINRLGTSVDTKTAPLSVRRNRIKRLLSESYRLTEEQLKRGYDIVLTAKKDVSKLGLDTVKSEILSLYKKSDILR